MSLDEQVILKLLIKLKRESPAIYRHIWGMIVAISEKINSSYRF